MKAWAGYLLTVLATAAAVSGLALIFVDRGSWWIIGLTAAVATVVQMSAFAVAYAFRKELVMVGWGLGSLIRMLALVLYWLVVARLWRASLSPALMSLVAMFFVATVVEPLFLRK